jgi:hypothetical protein
MHDGVTTYELLQFLHVFLFVFWLGPDVAVYVWSRKTVEAGASAEQRVVAGQMMALVDFIPRAAISLMLTVGGLLSEYVGLEHPWWQMAGIILLGPVWLALVLAGLIRDGTPFGATAQQLESWLRWVLIVAVPVSVAYSTLTGRLAIAPYVGAKLLLFAAILLFGYLLRARLAPLPYTVAIWLALLAAAFMGVLKPGVPDEPLPDAGILRFDQSLGAPTTKQ